MKAIILAAGLGTRLRPLTDDIPKCLVPIQGRPLLGFWLEALLGTGLVDEVRINTHHLASQVEAFARESPWAERINLVHEDVLLGTGGTVLAAREWLGGETFLVLHGDNLTDADIGALVEAHRNAGPDVLLTLLAFRTDRPRDCGILELDGGDRVVGFHEKVQDPPGNLANGAIYVVEPAVLDFMAGLRGPFIDFSTQVIPALLPRVLAVEDAGFFRDIGTPQALAEAELRFRPPR